MPKIKYPKYFEDGLIGVECTDDIRHREAFLFVPVKMLLTVKKAKEHPVLSKVIEDNPDVFSSEKNQDSDHFILVLFLFYETCLGTQSFWFPYI